MCRDILRGRRLWSQEWYGCALADEEERSHQSSAQWDTWDARGCKKCRKHAEGERKCIKNGARCGMGVWDGNKSKS